MEDLNRKRTYDGKKMANDDFIEDNAKIMLQKKERQQLAEMMKLKDSYNYFPFISGELIE